MWAAMAAHMMAAHMRHCWTLISPAGPIPVSYCRAACDEPTAFCIVLSVLLQMLRTVLLLCSLSGAHCTKPDPHRQRPLLGLGLLQAAPEALQRPCQSHAAPKPIVAG